MTSTSPSTEPGTKVSCVSMQFVINKILTGFNFTQNIPFKQFTLQTYVSQVIIIFVLPVQHNNILQTEHKVPPLKETCGI